MAKGLIMPQRTSVPFIRNLCNVDRESKGSQENRSKDVVIEDTCPFHRNFYTASFIQDIDTLEIHSFRRRYLLAHLFRKLDEFLDTNRGNESGNSGSFLFKPPRYWKGTIIFFVPWEYEISKNKYYVRREIREKREILLFKETTSEFE